MNPEELQKSWLVTTKHLQAAADHLKEMGMVNSLTGYDEYLNHNELELALDDLMTLCGDIHCSDKRVWSELRNAASNMGLYNHVKRIDAMAKDTK